MNLILILFQKFNFMPEASSCPTFQLCKWTTSVVPSIFQWLTASLNLAFNSFARSFHPGTLNFEDFHIPNICLPRLSIAFDINVNKSLSLFASVPLLIRSCLSLVPHLAHYSTSDRIEILIQHLQISNLCACLFVSLCCESFAVGQN